MNWILLELVYLAGLGTPLLGWKYLKSRLSNEIRRFANDYVGEWMQNIAQHPEIVAPLVESLMQSIMKSAGVTKEAGAQGMKIGGIKIPAWVLQMAMPTLQKALEKNAGTAVQSAAESVF